MYGILSNIDFFKAEYKENIEGTLYKSHWISETMYWSFFFLSYLACILFWLFRIQIKSIYQNKETILKMQKNTFWSLFGWILLISIIGRMILVTMAGMDSESGERLWEIFPFHFCRLMLLIIAISLIFKKTQWAKYYTFPTFITVTIAVFGKGFHKYSGPDNFWWWDYVIAHIFLLIVSTFLYVLLNDSYKFKDKLITILAFVIIAIIMFVINWILFDYGKPGWQSNYFYLGKDKVNEFSGDGIFKLLSWPYHILTWIVVSFIFMSITIYVCALGSKVYILKNLENKYRLSIKKSDFWYEYKKSFSELFSKRTNNIKKDK
ncbi:YwaF family protein [Mycoplasma sp. Mirounga ES2805-ORL]|uniref:YwaF family protein n=1 Tax=Mycoplasma sp. Mirounga ES2805-ORL TaxID=754514 RepID=UPI00197B5BDC|nr:YwaF family protein [Mycoplasma sp. Mirounga ES2805-ORL]QSF13922.1 YwaF family protein [Mycoplasma sp. Mirounga ES2805-ORL]